jgi:Na+/proline symporter
MGSGLHALDWGILLAYLAAMLWIGFRYAGRARSSLDEFFLSGRSLPWWLTGTSMVATSFSCDTPLVISGWVRDFGLWKNWVWWCYAISGSLQIFLFARWWRKAGVMTKAELVELRYGSREASLLRAALGLLHALVVNTITLGWVLVAATKIAGTLFGAGKLETLVLASGIALAYCTLAGMWGVVLTDFAQFAIAMLGALVLCWVAWGEVGGATGLARAAQEGALAPEVLTLFPAAGPGTPLDASFWSVSFTALAVYLGVAWWAAESVDGAGAAVQRIAASRDERQGALAVLWFDVAHYALRPWLWIGVGLASLVLLPARELRADGDGTVVAVSAGEIMLERTDGTRAGLALHATGESDWRALPRVAPGERVAEGQLLARTDGEAAYVVMLRRYLPAGLLGLVLAALLAAFMSTIDTHVNLAASFFVNDVYRRFLVPGASDRHYVRAARWASVGALAIGALVAWLSDSISGMFLFFLSLLGGVGPVYILRWLWWRVRASTEVVAMLTSALTTTLLTALEIEWSLGPLSQQGRLLPEGRLLLVVALSLGLALLSFLFTPRPDPAALVPFYLRVRPIGWWGPVRALAGVGADRGELWPSCLGSLGGVALILGATLAPGFWLLRSPLALGVTLAAALAGGISVAWSLRRLFAPTPAAGTVTPSGRS